MPKTASMTVIEADDAIRNQLGSRPISIKKYNDQEQTKKNRGLVRKWFIAKGLPSSFVSGLSYAELENGYNQPDGKGWEQVQRKYDEREPDDTDSNETETVRVNAETEVHTVEIPEIKVEPETKKTSSTVEQAIKDLIEATNTRAQVDEQSVIALIDKRLESFVKTVRVEIQNADGNVKTIDGHLHPAFPMLVKLASSRGTNGFMQNVFVSGEASSGKTTGTEKLAEALSLKWYHQGAASQAYELTGYIDGHGNYHRTPLRDAWEHGGVLCMDELDGFDSAALLPVYAHLAGSHIAAFPDGMVERHKDCVIIGTANTWGTGPTAEYVGRNKLDAAFLSRFAIRLPWNIDRDFEVAISGNVDWARHVQSVRDKVQRAGLKIMVDMRVTIAGAALIAGGLSTEQASECTYLAALNPEQRRLIAA
jgi:hypothetical protein